MIQPTSLTKTTSLGHWPCDLLGTWLAAGSTLPTCVAPWGSLATAGSLPLQPAQPMGPLQGALKVPHPPQTPLLGSPNLDLPQISHATSLSQFRASAFPGISPASETPLQHLSMAVRGGRTHLAGRGGQMARISFVGTDLPHQASPHPRGLRTPFQLDPQLPLVLCSAELVFAAALKIWFQSGD